jgi:hypothetical protein
MPFYEPITVLEPALGSGILLLAAASQYPDWANYYNLVRYYGQDIDPDCVTMARINEKLYALNGYGLRLAVALVEGLAEREYGQQQVGIAPAAPVEILAKTARYTNGKNGNGVPPSNNGAHRLSDVAALSFTDLFTKKADLVTALTKSITNNRNL